MRYLTVVLLRTPPLSPPVLPKKSDVIGCHKATLNWTYMLLSVFCDHVFNIKGYANHVRLMSDYRHQINNHGISFIHVLETYPLGVVPIWINRLIFIMEITTMRRHGLCIDPGPGPLKGSFSTTCTMSELQNDRTWYCIFIGSKQIIVSNSKYHRNVFFFVGYMIVITLKLHGGLYQYEKNIDLVYHQLMSNTVHLLYRVILTLDPHAHIHNHSVLLAQRCWYRIYTFISISITSRN